MAEIEDAINQLAAGQAGALSWRQLRYLGIGVEAARHAAKFKRLRHVEFGVYVANGSPSTWLQKLWIAHLVAGPESVLSHGTAGRQWGFDGVAKGPIVVTIPHRRGSPPSGVVVHRSRRLGAADVAMFNGLPFTTPGRTVLDLAAESSAARLGIIVDSCHFSGRARYDEIGMVLLRVGGRGRKRSGRLAQVLDDRCGDPLAMSHLEVLLGELVTAAGLRIGRDAVRQHPLPSHGQIKGTVDMFLPRFDLIIETDGRRWHQRQSDMKRDRERDFAAAQVGVMTLRFLYEHLVSDLDGCVDGLLRVMASRSRVCG